MQTPRACTPNVQFDKVASLVYDQILTNVDGERRAVDGDQSWSRDEVRSRGSSRRPSEI